MVNIIACKAFMYDIIGAIYEVRNEMGAGLNENCYKEAMEIQLQEMQIEYMREVAFRPMFHGKTLNSSFRLDFLCKNDIIVECKSVTTLNENHRAQLFNYMHLLKFSYGILVNFAPKNLEMERYLYDKEHDEILNIYGRRLGSCHQSDGENELK